MTLHGGQAVPTGRRSDASLYDFGLATYDAGDTFDQGLAKGFVRLWGLPSKIAASGPARGRRGLVSERSGRRVANATNERQGGVGMSGL